MSTLESLFSRIRNLMTIDRAPGLAVGAIKDGKIVLAQGFGKRSMESDALVNADTLFAVGSTTKAFTTMGLGMLVDEGKLDWDKSVREYLPEFKLYDNVASERATLRDMACHRTGLPRYDAMVIFNPPEKRAGFTDRLAHLKPTQDFRTYWQYNNAMFTLLGHVIERVTDQSWETFIEKRIFSPLKMTNSNLHINDMQKSSNHVLAHREVEGEVRQVAHLPIITTGPAGSINSSINDMLKWLELHLNKGKNQDDQFIQEATLAEMHKPQMVINSSSMPLEPERGGIQGYGLGWFVSHYRGHHLVEHGGSTGGCQAVVSFLPKENIGVVVLCNKGGRLPDYISYAVFDYLLGLEPIDWASRLEIALNRNKEARKAQETKNLVKHIENTRPSHDISEYSGVYEHPGMGAIKVELAEDNSLIAKYGILTMPLVHYHYDVFGADLPELDMKMKFTFNGDVKGNIASVSVPLGWDPLVEDLVFHKPTKKED